VRLAETRATSRSLSFGVRLAAPDSFRTFRGRSSDGTTTTIPIPLDLLSRVASSTMPMASTESSSMSPEAARHDRAREELTLILKAVDGNDSPFAAWVQLVVWR
jgi:hypothetical protein